jgi:hypothetical protein
MAPDDKFLNMLQVSHGIFFQRYPSKKPSFSANARTVIRFWLLGLFVEPLAVRYRGFPRFFQRLLTITKFHYRLRGYEPEQAIPPANRSQSATRSSDS